MAARAVELSKVDVVKSAGAAEVSDNYEDVIDITDAIAIGIA